MSVAVASIQPASVVYREEQNFAWWVYALIVLLEALAWTMLAWYFQKAPNHAPPANFGLLPPPIGIGLLLVLPILFILFVLRMTTEVMPTTVVVWFGWVPSYRRTISIASIQRLEVVSYRPIADYGGWGIRRGRDGERVLNARGNRGVRLELADGSRLLIGSQRPEALAQAIELALRPGL